MNTERNGIVINRMYAGDYLSTNMGHEVINLYKTDEGEHYLYLNATGDFAPMHQDKIGYMLLTMHICKGAMEILGVAIGLEDMYRSGDGHAEQSSSIHGITYGSVPIVDIFNDAEQQNIFVTFKAKELFVPERKRIFLHGHNLDQEEWKELKKSKPKEEEWSAVQLTRLNLGTTSLKQYIYENDFEKDYSIIFNSIINNIGNNGWKLSNEQVDKSMIDKPCCRSISLFDICRLQNSELAFSNALFYFMQHPKYKSIWREFFNDKYHLKLSENYTVAREQNATIPKKSKNGVSTEEGVGANDVKKRSGSIDLFITDKKNNRVIDKYIIIENKIESDINKSSEDKNGSNQLVRYWKYAQWLAKHERGNDEDKVASNVIVKGFVLHPNYSHVELNYSEYPKNAYKKITYKELYDFLESKKEKHFSNDVNFIAFLEAMKRHTFNTVSEYMKREMEEKFYSRIKDVRARNGNQ